MDACESVIIPVYRGSETNLVDRHYQVGRVWGADFGSKIPLNCPLSDPVIIDRVFLHWFNNQDWYDYVRNYHPPTFPEGLDVEGAPMPLLEAAWREARRLLEREHTFPFIWDQPDRFRIGNVINPRKGRLSAAPIGPRAYGTPRGTGYLAQASARGCRDLP